MSSVLSSLSSDAMWPFLPVVAAVCVAIGSFLYLQTVMEKRSVVSAADKAEFRQKMLVEGKKVVERAKQKAAEDAAAIAAHVQDALHLASSSTNSTDTAEPSATIKKSNSADAGLKKRKGAAVTPATNTKSMHSSAADDSGPASDNDWELVDDDNIEQAEESQYEAPIEYQQAVEKFTETLHETPLTAVDELHAAVKTFFTVFCGLLDGSSHVTPLPSKPSSSTATPSPPELSPTDRYATRNVILAQLVDTQSLHALHELVGAHPGTPLAADAQHLHDLLVPLLHSH